MSTVRLLISLCALGVLSRIPGARTQGNECPVLQAEELGNASAPSTTGLIADSYVNQEGENPPRPNVQLFASNIVCLAAGQMRGRYRSVSVIANFSCSGSACENNNIAWQIAQFHLECVAGTWAASVMGSADFLITESPVGNLSTMLRRDCTLCIEPQQLQLPARDAVDEATHCLPCSQTCIGTGTCFSALAEGCCNFYDRNGTCTLACPNGEVPDNQFQCSVAGIIVGFEFASYSFNEDAGVVMVTINSSVALPPNAEIQVSGGSVMQPSTVIPSGPALINQTLTTLPATVSFTISDDSTALETVEEFSIILSSSDPSVAIGGPGLFGTTQISIMDDDVVVVGFSESTYTFGEADAQVTVTVQGSNSVARNFEILITKANVPAGPFVTSPALPTLNTTVQFGSGAMPPSVDVTITLQDDNIALEGTERVVLDVVNIDSDSRIVVGGNISSTTMQSGSGSTPLSVDVTMEVFPETDISILDDDPVTVSFLRARHEFVEDTRATPAVFVQLVSPVARPVTVRVEGDPTAPPLPFVFPSLPLINSTAQLAQPTLVAVNFGIVDDSIGLEDEEVTVVQLRVVDPDPSGFQVNLVPFAETQVAVLDNEFVRIGFQQLAYTVSEAAGTVEVCAVASSTTIRPINFTVNTQNGTALAGEDFVGGTFSSDIPANGNRGCVQIQLILNPEMEANETFSVNLALTTMFASGLALDMMRDTATITITDSPPPAPPPVLFMFQQPMYMLIENVGAMGQACVVKSGNTSATHQVSVTFSNTGSVQTLEFGPDDSEQCVNLQIQDDNIALEETEVFTLTLVPPGQPGAALGQFNTTTVMVLDDDVLVLSVQKTPEIPENVGTTPVCVQFSAPFAQPFPLSVQSMQLPEFNMSTMGGMFSASPDVDYGRINQTLDVSLLDSAAGETCFNITIEDDSEPETMECLVVVLQLPANAPEMVQIAPGNESTICCIVDDDAPTVFTECVVRSSFSARTNITTFEEAIMYPFNTTCEHHLVTSCDALGTEFSIRIDQLDGQLYTSSVGVYYRNVAAVLREEDVEVISGDPSQYEVLQLLGGTTFILRELGNLSVSFVSEALGAVSVRVRIDTQVLPNACGLCGNTSGQTVLRDSSLVDVEDESQLQRFLDEYFVNPGETRLIQTERLECGLIRNDTVIGDPLFTVPISGLPDRYLCYEIHGRPSQYFNLISDECVSVNAHYVQRTRQFMVNGEVRSEVLNVIDQIGIQAVDNSGQCVNVAVNVSGCAASVNGIATPSYSQAGIRMRQFSNHVRVAVPNCADTNLVMRVFCQNISRVEMIKFVVSRGLNIRETAHGLIGQFWNIPFSVQRYTGQTRGDNSDNVYIMTVTPPEGDPRSFAVWSEEQTWDGTNVPCLYAGNRQGGPVYEVQDPNDPLIEGRYFQYRVDGPFATQFEYSHFNEEMCR